MRLLASVPVQALLQFEIVRVKLLLLPSMTVRASILQVAAIFIRGDKVLGVPILAHLHLVAKDRRLPSVVLPVVGIDADVSFMVVLSVGTPDCFKVKDVKIHVRLKFLYQLYREISFVMSERAKLPIFALFILSIKVA